MSLPAIMIDPHRAWPEVPSKIQSSQDATRPMAVLSLYAAYLMSGTPLNGPAADIPFEILYDKLVEGCKEHSLDLNRVLDWAESINMDYTEIRDPTGLVPRSMPHRGLTLRTYQYESAVWSASRMGSILALSCGVGKTLTASAAAIGAYKLGKCSNERCYIFAPLNALGAWDSYCTDLREVFKDVKILSLDSAHRWKGLPRHLGGAMIIDELHNAKTEGARRSMAMTEIRGAFQWCVGLTGTLLHAGPEGILQVQDLVLPGSCRFFNKWAFGDAFKCVVEVPAGRRTRKMLVIPPAEQQGPFCAYMARFVKSLSQTSPDVADTLKLPGLTSMTLDTWEEPAWVQERRKEVLTYDDGNRVLWSGNLVGKAARLYIGAFTLALADEIANTPEVKPDGDDADDAADEAAEAAVVQQSLGGQLEIDPGEQELPSFALVLSALRKEGIYDRAIQKIITADGDVRYSFIYPTDTLDPLNMPLGPKILHVLDWLDKNPDEPLVVAAYHRETVTLLASLFDKRGDTYRMIRGGVKRQDRKVSIAEFQEGKVRIMLMQQKAGSESIELTRAANSMLIEHSWIPATYTQFMARTYRGGQERPCNHYDLTFGEFQLHMLRKLIRGEGFDAAVRHQLEQAWDYQTNLRNAKIGNDLESET